MYNHHVVCRKLSLRNMQISQYFYRQSSVEIALSSWIFCTKHLNSLLAIPVFTVSFSTSYLIATSIPLLIIHAMFNPCVEHNLFSSTKSLLKSYFKWELFINFSKYAHISWIYENILPSLYLSFIPLTLLIRHHV